MRYRMMICVCFVLLSCKEKPSEPSQNTNPLWIAELIAEYQSEPVGNPPQSIWRYEYKNQTVYYVPPQCCDQYSILFNAAGDTLGAPDGGIAGTGDGRCTDFFQERKNEVLIWKDSRTR